MKKIKKNSIERQEVEKALIYCRVSSERQKKEGNGLNSQEKRCRMYAEEKGYKVEQVFKDDYSGAGDFMNRPQMKNLIDYIDMNGHKRYAVIFDDLKRFARDTEFHIKLRATFKARHAVLECLNYKFEDTPEGKFTETIFAAQAELEREQNRRQVIQKQLARLQMGYWPFNPNIPGYKRDDASKRDWILVKKEPEASIIKEALEGFAKNRFRNQIDIQEFLKKKNFFGTKSSNIVHLEQVKRLLTRPLYAGYVDHKNWGIAMVKGKHEPLISLETFQKNQEKLRDKKKLDYALITQKTFH